MLPLKSSIMLLLLFLINYCICLPIDDNYQSSSLIPGRYDSFLRFNPYSLIKRFFARSFLSPSSQRHFYYEPTYWGIGRITLLANKWPLHYNLPFINDDKIPKSLVTEGILLGQMKDVDEINEIEDYEKESEDDEDTNQEDHLNLTRNPVEDEESIADDLISISIPSLDDSKGESIAVEEIPLDQVSFELSDESPVHEKQSQKENVINDGDKSNAKDSSLVEESTPLEENGKESLDPSVVNMIISIACICGVFVVLLTAGITHLLKRKNNEKSLETHFEKVQFSSKAKIASPKPALLKP